MPSWTVRVTENFAENLESIASFLRDSGAPDLFAEVPEQVFGTLIPNLQRFPELGVDLLARAATSIEAQSRIERLLKRLAGGESIREYVTGDYLVLYAVLRGTVFLLALKHHRQLFYDLRGNWGI